MATTGIIENLKDKNYDVKKWLLEDVVRLFGVCVIFRDRCEKLSQEQILEELKKDDEQRENYRQKDLNPVYPTMPTKEELRKAYEYSKKSKQQYEKQILERREKVYKCIREFSEIRAKNLRSNDELINNLLEEAKRQLNILKDDVEYDFAWLQTEKAKNETFEQFCLKTKERIDNERNCLDRRKKQAQDRKINKNAETYQRLINAINK